MARLVCSALHIPGAWLCSAGGTPLELGGRVARRRARTSCRRVRPPPAARAFPPRASGPPRRAARSRARRGSARAGTPRTARSAPRAAGCRPAAGAEVAQPGAQLRRVEDVRRLEVPVQDAGEVRRGEPLGHLGEHLADEPQGQPVPEGPAAAHVHLVQVDAVHVLPHEQRRALVDAHVGGAYCGPRSRNPRFVRQTRTWCERHSYLETPARRRDVVTERPGRRPRLCGSTAPRYSSWARGRSTP